MRKELVRGIAALLAFAFVSSAYAETEAGATTLYSPDIVEEHLVEGLNHDGGNIPALPSLMSFNADMVNVENIVGDGEGVYVAVLDTGMLPNAHDDYFANANIAWHLGKGFSHDFYYDPDLGYTVLGPLRDDRGIMTQWASGHGTHVTSTIAGFDVFGSFNVRGIAPKATIIPVLVLDAWVVPTPDGLEYYSGGTDAMISAGIRYVADLADTLDGRVVINMSLGGPSRSPMIEDAVNYALSKNVVVVASAGNEGELGMGYPGGLPQLISVGSIGWASMVAYGWRADVPEKENSNDILGNNTQYYLAGYSSRPVKQLGQKHQHLDISAPGDLVVGPYKSGFQNNTSYYYLSGTSMAAPHVSAIAAMLLAQEPHLTPAEVERRIRQAGHGNPLPADGAGFLYLDGNVYGESWKGGDYGTGFLKADHVVN